MIKSVEKKVLTRAKVTGSAAEEGGKINMQVHPGMPRAECSENWNDTQGLGMFLSFLGAWFASGQCVVNFLLPFGCHF